MDKRDIIFVRHGESTANAGLSTKNPGSVPLSPKGIIQVEKLVKKIKSKPGLIIVSKYLRTQESAKPLIAKYKGVKVEKWGMTHEFTYLNRKKCADTTKFDRAVFAKEYWKKNNPFYKDGQSEESFFDLLIRAEKFLVKINKRKEEKIIISLANVQPNKIYFK